MPNKEEAQAALSGLNGQDIKGRSLKISEARPKQDRGDRRGGDRFDRGDRGDRGRRSF
jgi:RNA recognition motif-containing protein